VKKLAARQSLAICIAASMAAGILLKMVHNGIEYGVMAAYAEGLGVFECSQCRQEGRRY